MAGFCQAFNLGAATSPALPREPLTWPQPKHGSPSFEDPDSRQLAGPLRGGLPGRRGASTGAAEEAGAAQLPLAVLRVPPAATEPRPQGPVPCWCAEGPVSALPSSRRGGSGCRPGQAWLAVGSPAHCPTPCPGDLALATGWQVGPGVGSGHPSCRAWVAQPHLAGHLGPSWEPA